MAGYNDRSDCAIKKRFERDLSQGARSNERRLAEPPAQRSLNAKSGFARPNAQAL